MAQTKETGDYGVQNGSKVNGHQNGVPATSKNAGKSTSTGKSKGSQGGIVSTLLKYRGASRRPLPTDMGDGSYRKVDKRPGLRQDLGTIGLAGK